jgi:hypothetical protein
MPRRRRKKQGGILSAILVGAIIVVGAYALFSGALLGICGLALLLLFAGACLAFLRGLSGMR